MPTRRRKPQKDLRKDPRYKYAMEWKGVSIDPQGGLPGGAHSVGIGRKIVNGKRTNRVAIRYYVEKKLAQGELSSARAVPKAHKFFSRAKGGNVTVLTDIIETPQAEFEVDPKSRLRPVPGGSSIGTPPPPGFISAGTLGGWVWDKEDDSIVMLSNEHVLGTAVGVDVVQPGTLDGGSFPGDKIGDVKRGIPRSTTTTNKVDCAIADPDSTAIYKTEVIEIGAAVYAIDTALEDMQVEKFGRTTLHTYGTITDDSYTTTLTSGHTFTDCFRVDARAPSADWSAGGDSGSLCFSSTNLPDSELKPVVGLHFAGASTYGVECRIQNVFSALNLTTLCAGAFAAFLDSLFESEAAGEAISASEIDFESLGSIAARRPVIRMPRSFARKDRKIRGSTRFYSGISRDLQGRLKTTTRGRQMVDFVDKHRGELLDLLVHNADIRRATVATVRPLVAGAVTTTDVFDRTLTNRDITSLKKLAKELRRSASGRKLKTSLKMLESLTNRAGGKKIGQIFGIKT
jgi:hypothetical protein